MWDWFFSGPYVESRIAAAITPIILAIYWVLTASKDSSGSSREGSTKDSKRPPESVE